MISAKKLLRFALMLAIVPAFMGFSKKVYVGTAADQYYIIIKKSENTLTVYDQNDWVVQYPCTFGSDDLGDKMYQGDRRTPIGTYHIANKKSPHKWDRYMGLDYPTKDDRTKFTQRKAAKLIPKNAKLGGDIGIHGTWPHEEFAVELLQNWTMGCISLKNADVEELFDMVSTGTKVIIQK